MVASECISFLLIDIDMVLLEQRSQRKKTDPGLITLPGGHIESGESQEQALLRELKEELDIEPISYSYLCSLYHPTNELQLIHYYVVHAWQGEIKSLEADDVTWHSLAVAPVGIEADKIALSEYLRIHGDCTNPQNDLKVYPRLRSF